ncbi:hypothetical protein ABZ350_08785, partial [Streptomyces uncialis]
MFHVEQGQCRYSRVGDRTAPSPAPRRPRAPGTGHRAPGTTHTAGYLTPYLLPTVVGRLDDTLALSVA